MAYGGLIRLELHRGLNSNACIVLDETATSQASSTNLLISFKVLEPVGVQYLAMSEDELSYVRLNFDTDAIEYVGYSVGINPGIPSTLFDGEYKSIRIGYTNKDLKYLGNNKTKDGVFKGELSYIYFYDFQIYYHTFYISEFKQFTITSKEAGTATIENYSDDVWQEANTSQSSFSLQEEQTYDLDVIRNKAFLGSVTLIGRVLKSDVVVGEPIYI